MPDSRLSQFDTSRRIKFRYHHEEDVWWAESDQVRWVGQCDTLEELRQRTAEGIRFAASDGEAIEPPARSLMFVQWHPSPLVTLEADAVEEFILEPVDA